MQQSLNFSEKESGMEGKTEHYCRACKAPVQSGASSQGAAWVLCPIHAAAVAFDRRAQEIVRIITGDIAYGKIVLERDANGAGWGHPVPLKPAPKGVDIVMDDGVTPRYQDWKSPLIEDGDEVISDGE
jgi:hypothetical protein